MKKLKKLTKSIFGAGRLKTLAMMLMFGTALTFAQNAAGDYSAGTSALASVTEEIAKYVPYVVKLCYAIAGVVAVVGAISVYISMNNEEQDVKKKIMMVVGACIFLVAAAQALPIVLRYLILRLKNRLLSWQQNKSTINTSAIPYSRGFRNLRNSWVSKGDISHGQLVL